MKLTSRDRVLLGVVAALALCAAFYVLVITPERHTAAHLQAQVAAARTKLARAQQRMADGRAAETALNASQADWGATQRAVPQVADVPALLKVLTRSAHAAHVSMQSISLSGSGTSSTSGTQAVSSVAGATTIPVSLSFQGGYQALNRLVDRLDAFVTISRRSIRSHGPLIGIGNVSVTSTQSNSHSSTLSVQLTATIYQRSATSSTTTGATG
jgi:Tfp pilus assembly protein PilO